ncbi:MAG TPA: sodium-dependent bicarbonate transport family permease [Coriobacteriia bacterium]|nr:sodium-dependent bicarbonate transport family permease [Coriobacteriia bacterium]
MALSDFISQVTTPQLLFFVVGMVAALVESDLKIPEAMSTAMMLFLLCAIGLKGGVGLSEVSLSEAVFPSIAAVALGVGIVALGYSVLRRLGFDAANAGSIAGHCGAVSAVTMVVGFAYLDRLGVPYESFIPALYPFMDSFAIITAIVIARFALDRARPGTTRVNIGGLVKHSVRGRSVLVLGAALLVGYIAGAEGTAPIMPFFGDMFRGILCLFMLDMGLLAAERLHEWKTLGPKLVGFALVMPPVHGILGVVLGRASGLGVGGATMLGVFAASASYISAPAAMRSALPEGNPSLALTASVALIFPFNVFFGVPLYHAVSTFIARL